MPCIPHTDLFYIADHQINSIKWELCTALSPSLVSTWRLHYVKRLIKQPKMEKCMYRWLIWDYCQCRIFSGTIEYQFHIEKYPYSQNEWKAIINLFLQQGHKSGTYPDLAYVFSGGIYSYLEIFFIIQKLSALRFRMKYMYKNILDTTKPFMCTLYLAGEQLLTTFLLPLGYLVQVPNTLCLL